MTAAYKKKLEEEKQWLAEEKLREAEERKNDVVKKGHIGDFYRSAACSICCLHVIFALQSCIILHSQTFCMFVYFLLPACIMLLMSTIDKHHHSRSNAGPDCA